MRTDLDSTAPAALSLPEAVEAADRRTLAATLTHLSGDPQLIADPRDGDAIRALAVQMLPRFLEGGPPAPPDDEILQAAMNLAAGTEVPAEYRPLVREFAALGPDAPAAPLNAPPGFSIVIIGSGITGLAAATYLERAGFASFTIVDKNPEPGGTWWQNRYPGCRVDTPSLVYSYSFDIDPGWPHHFSHQPALMEYMSRTADRFRDRLQTETEVLAIRWDTDRWRLTVRRGDGSEAELEANAVIAATGYLQVPKLPDIPGRDRFAGPAVHSTQWDPDLDLAGKKVAIIGTGASANQIVPAIADVASEVVVYQRTPHWVMAHPFYDKALTGIEQWLIECVPAYKSWFRFRQFWSVGDRLLPFMRIDPEWNGDGRSISATNDELRERLTDYIASELAGRPDLIEKTLPSYPPYGKRMVIDNGWYRALLRPNVHLVTEAIEEITAAGPRTAAGVTDVDLIVYATGFSTNRTLWPIEVVGRSGADVRRRLDEHPMAYLGMALEDCPNLFMTTGPNGVLIHGGAGTFLAECQSSYIVECLRHMFDEHWKTMEVRPEAVAEFTDEMKRENSKYVWSSDAAHNWFSQAEGEASVVLPWTTLKMWQEGKHPDVDPYVGER